MKPTSTFPRARRDELTDAQVRWLYRHGVDPYTVRRLDGLGDRVTFPIPWSDLLHHLDQILTIPAGTA